ncbi:hypothetical protein EX30DRAFT_344709 [Ascodesmis nigricans]|uniref:Pinin/SDK/MemA protein domain-containing protein n=1 Tax=Ascodesmis nigricans TaxID=341454 RepID=A0A4S2MQA1_9PEZI|nr:hypothetical protein EX30DRAFT_344709 [Ascodesmis nigricans]
MEADNEPITIASAVVLPTDEDSPTLAPTNPTSPLFKRRASSPDPSPSSKRARTSRSPSPHSRRPQPPAQRRSVPGGATNNDEEKRRGKRLFGALLGTIGQFKKETGTQRARSTAVKRMEVEEKMKEKLKAQNEELDEKRKRELEIEAWRRKRERRRWEKRVMKCRHEGERARAGMLKTSAEPALYYLPWKLLPSEEDLIAAQIDETEARIEREELDMEDLIAREEEEMKATGISLEDFEDPLMKQESSGPDTKDEIIPERKHDDDAAMDTADETPGMNGAAHDKKIVETTPGEEDTKRLQDGALGESETTSGDQKEEMVNSDTPANGAGESVNNESPIEPKPAVVEESTMEEPVDIAEDEDQVIYD